MGLLGKKGLEISLQEKKNCCHKNNKEKKLYPLFRPITAYPWKKYNRYIPQINKSDQLSNPLLYPECGKRGRKEERGNNFQKAGRRAGGTQLEKSASFPDFTQGDWNSKGREKRKGEFEERGIE